MEWDDVFRPRVDAQRRLKPSDSNEEAATADTKVLFPPGTKWVCESAFLPSFPCMLKHLSTTFNHLLVPPLSMLISLCWLMDCSPLPSSSLHTYQQPLAKCVRRQSEVKVTNENRRLTQSISRADLLSTSSTYTWWPVPQHDKNHPLARNRVLKRTISSVQTGTSASFSGTVLCVFSSAEFNKDLRNL